MKQLKYNKKKSNDKRFLIHNYIFLNMDNVIAITINSNRKSTKQKHLNKYNLKAVERILKRKKSNNLISWILELYTNKYE